MAKSDSFFLRARIATNGLTYAETAIDLGSVVNVLAKDVLRIHNVSVQYGDGTSVPAAGANDNAQTGFQLTTQTQTSLVGISDRSVIASGKLTVGTGAANNTSLSDASDLSPSDFTNGYLVAVEQIFLGTDSAVSAAVDSVSIVLECTSETMSQSAAMALSLSQQ